MQFVKAPSTFVDVTSEVVSDVVAERVKAVRKKRGLTASQLAERCAEVGTPELTAQALSNIETGRRDKEGRRRRYVTVDEVVALALALGVAPVHLLIDPEGDDYQVTPTHAEPSTAVRAWVRGFRPLEGTDTRMFWAEVPPAEFGVQEDAPGRQEWVREVTAYLSRSMGRMYRREDGTVVFEVERPRGDRDGQGLD